MKTWTLLPLAVLLFAGLASGASAVDDPRYLLRAYRLAPDVAIEADKPFPAAADAEECPLRDVGEAMLNGTLKIDGTAALLVVGELAWGEPGASSSLSPGTFSVVPYVGRDAFSVPMSVSTGIFLRDPIATHLLPLDPAEAEYLTPKADGSYQLERLDPRPGLTVSPSVPAPGRLHLEIEQNIVSGRMGLAGSALSAGKPILKHCTSSGELVMTANGSYVGLLTLASSGSCLLVFAPVPPPLPPDATSVQAFSTEIRVLRLDDDALTRDSRCRLVEDPGIIEGARAFRLEAARWTELMQEHFPGELLSAPRLTLPDASIPAKEGDALVKIVLRSQLIGSGTWGSVGGGTNPRENRTWEDILQPYIDLFGGESARFLSMDFLKRGGVIVDGSLFVGVVRCSSTEAADTIKRELYLATRADDGESASTIAFHATAPAQLDVHYAFVPTTQPDKGTIVFVVTTTNNDEQNRQFVDVSNESKPAN